MKIEKAKSVPIVNPAQIVRVKRMSNITEIRSMNRTQFINVQKLSKELFIIKSTGEVKEFQKHNQSRADDLLSVSRSLRRLCDLLNTNIEDTRKCLWLTLTYAENMTDEKRLYDDFRKFNMRLQNHLKCSGLPHYEYVVAMEPQGRGAWHAHLILIFPDKAPFIPNSVIARIWKLGFVSVKALTDCDNVGAYMTAYLGDMSLDEAIHSKSTRGEIKEVTEAKQGGKKQSKYYVKGARLRLYPPGFRLFRKSKGIKEPEIIEMTEAEAMQEVKDAKMTYERAIKLVDDDGSVHNVITYRYFNSKPKFKPVTDKTFSDKS